MPLERVLALDVGDRRIGLAISDPLGLSARPLSTIDRQAHGEEAALSAILRCLEQELPDRLIVGDPRLPSGERGEQSRLTDGFVDRLQTALARRFGSAAPPIERHDESNTTQAALERLTARGMDPRLARESGRLDAEAAAIILEEWLVARDGLRLPPPD